MNANPRKRILVVAAAAAVVIVAVAGCSSKKSSSGAPAATSQPAPSTAPPRSGAGHTTSPGRMTPAGTIPEMWAQIDGEQGKLTSALQNGQLKDVRPLAIGIRDIAAALADTAKVATPAIAPRIDNMVVQLDSSATELGQLGDAGNVGGAQTEFAKLEAILDAIRSVTLEK